MVCKTTLKIFRNRKEIFIMKEGADNEERRLYIR